MSQGILFGDFVQIPGGQLSERTARRRQYKIFDLLAPFTFQTLKNGVVLTIDG
jgi:hypothetical protein